MYKIQLGWEQGFYVAYLVKHTEGLTQATIIEEIEAFEVDDLLEAIPDDWKEKLTNFLNN